MSSLRTEKGIQNLEEQGYLLFSDKYLLGSTRECEQEDEGTTRREYAYPQWARGLFKVADGKEVAI